MSRNDEGEKKRGGTCEALISAAPICNILDIVTDLEQNKISAMLVVEDGTVLGMVSSDLFVQRYLLRRLRSQTNLF